jgi:hypothetical protein
MIWDFVTVHGTGLMVCVSRHLDQCLYKQILVECLPGTMVAYGMELRKMSCPDTTVTQNIRQNGKKLVSEQPVKILK